MSSSLQPFAASVIKKNVLTLSELKTCAADVIKQEAGGDLLGSMLSHLAYEFGPQYVRDLWSKSECQWQQFVSDDFEDFIAKYVSWRLQSARFQLIISLISFTEITIHWKSRREFTAGDQNGVRRQIENETLRAGPQEEI